MKIYFEDDIIILRCALYQSVHAMRAAYFRDILVV